MKLITNKTLDELALRARENKRLRMNYNVHENLSDPVQRLFIAANSNSYFRPHHHRGKSEFAIALRGLFDVLLFDRDGKVTERVSIGPETGVLGLEIPADTCHTWLPRAEQSVFFEVKQGPYDPEISLVFAPWAPEEGSAAVEPFQIKLLAARVGDNIS